MPAVFNHWSVYPQFHCRVLGHVLNHITVICWCWCNVLPTSALESFCSHFSPSSYFSVIEIWLFHSSEQLAFFHPSLNVLFFFFSTVLSRSWFKYYPPGSLKAYHSKYFWQPVYFLASVCVSKWKLYWAYRMESKFFEKRRPFLFCLLKYLLLQAEHTGWHIVGARRGILCRRALLPPPGLLPAIWTAAWTLQCWGTVVQYLHKAHPPQPQSYYP